ncbi:hypothetical protein FOZ63_027651 [Perkinsus olseni]|uniref:Aluminum-activated malate transporter 1 n=2 Tax=Perkinsus olseni TaxID=32597 RepID=A0A7J6TEG0_PEROL|nr:hypothetical protein FOZ63_027651 [Perkinsus olseni]
MWAMFDSDFNYPWAFAFWRKTITTAWLAWSTGALVHLIASSIGDNRLWAVLFQYPFTFFYCLIHTHGGCKLNDIISGEPALVISNFTSTFYFVRAYREGMAIAVAGTYGITATFILLTLLRIFGMLPHQGPPPFERFAYAAANFYDVLLSYTCAGMKQEALINDAYHDFVDACVQLSSVQAPPQIGSPAWSMAGFLFSIRSAIFRGAFTDNMNRLYWDPLAADLLRLRSDVGLVLRDVGGKAREIDLKAGAREVESHLLEVDKKAFGDVEKVSTEELMRLQFMFGSMMYFAIRAGEFRKGILAEEKQEKSNTVITEVKALPSRFVAFWVNWWRKPLFSSIDGDQSLKSRLKFSLRMSISCTIVAVVLVVGGWYNEMVKEHGFWGILPCWLCFYPTTGGSILRGTWRAGGTIAGCCVALVCLAANNRNRVALFIEMWIVTFIGKLSSLYPRIGYGGRMFILGWYVVCMALTLGSDMSNHELMFAACWRMGLTLAGAVYASVVSGTVFPEYACDHTRMSSVRAIRDMSEGVQRAMTQFVDARSGSDPKSEIVDDRNSFGHELFVLWRAMISFRSEANAERKVLGNSRLIRPLSKLVVANGAGITQLIQAGLLLQNALVSNALEAEESVVSKQSLLVSALGDYARSLHTSTERLIGVMEGGDENNGSISATDDVNVSMQKCLDKFLAKREELVKDALSGSANPLITSDNFRIYHLVYALAVFSQSWNDIESTLLRRDLPMELLPYPSTSVDAPYGTESRPHLRSATHNETQQ